MDVITVSDAVSWLLAVAGALVVLANAWEKIMKAIKAAKAPNAEQDKRIGDLEAWKKSADDKFDNDNKRIGKLESGDRVTHKALLALLDHSLDGNNVQQMQEAKASLQDHLVSK